MLNEFLKVAYDQSMQAGQDEQIVSLIKRLPVGTLEKIASGQLKLSSMLNCDSGSGSHEWIEKFKDTPLFEEAIALERQELEADVADLQKRQMEDTQSHWKTMDSLRLQKKMLDLKLMEMESGGGEGGEDPGGPPPPDQGAPPPPPPAGDPGMSANPKIAHILAGMDKVSFGFGGASFGSRVGGMGGRGGFTGRGVAKAAPAAAPAAAAAAPASRTAPFQPANSALDHAKSVFNVSPQQFQAKIDSHYTKQMDSTMGRLGAAPQPRSPDALHNAPSSPAASHPAAASFFGGGGGPAPAPHPAAASFFGGGGAPAPAAAPARPAPQQGMLQGAGQAVAGAAKGLWGRARQAMTGAMGGMMGGVPQMAKASMALNMVSREKFASADQMGRMMARSDMAKMALDMATVRGVAGGLGKGLLKNKPALIGAAVGAAGGAAEGMSGPDGSVGKAIGHGLLGGAAGGAIGLGGHIAHDARRIAKKAPGLSVAEALKAGVNKRIKDTGRAAGFSNKDLSSHLMDVKRTGIHAQPEAASA